MDDTKKIVTGAIFILIAGLLILKGINPGFMNGFFGELTVWQVIWTAVIAIILVGALIKRELFVIIFSLAFLLFIFEGKFGIPHIPAWAIFPPAAFIFFGIEAMRPKHWHVCRDKDGNTVRFEYNSNGDREGATIIDSDGQNIDVSFGSTVKYFEMEDFKYSNLECNFGSIKAYYNNAKMAGSEAFISAEQNFGETEIYIPKEWKCIIKKSQAFGNVRDMGSGEWDGEHTVNIKAEANFGEIKIYRV